MDSLSDLMGRGGDPIVGRLDADEIRQLAARVATSPSTGTISRNKLTSRAGYKKTVP
jgi:hypothetical protein